MLDESKRDEALRHLQRGLQLERDNQLAEAADHYRQAIDAYPGLREAHNALGFYYQRRGMLAKAAEAFRNVTTIEGDFLAYFNLGYVLVELERYEEALDSFQSCLKLAPDDSATHLEIGYIHLSRGDYSQALNHLQMPLRAYPQDWEVHNLLGKCYLGLRRYDEALEAFGQALLLAADPIAQAELLDNITTVTRYREFRQLHSVKDQLYAEEGVIYLGSAQDDGLKVSTVHTYHFTYPDIATTLQRLIALVQSAGWQFTAVLPADTLTRPLAAALSRLLDVPLRRAEELHADDKALLTIAVAREPELLQLTIERLPCPTTTFCLGLNWQRHSRIVPDVIGIAAHSGCSVPWEAELRRLRADGARPEQIAACIAQATEQIRQSVAETPIDANLPRQIRYYTRTHRRVNVSR
jgi:Flp pilus assembly protein TadD